MRRLFAGSIALLAVLSAVLFLPVYAASPPEPVPVQTEATEVALGSVDAPARAARIQEGTTDPVAGVPETAPVLAVTRTGVAPFSLVGVTWEHDPAVSDVHVLVRTQDGDGDWGVWTEVDTEDSGTDTGADTGARLRGGTAPLWTGPSTGVQVEVATRSGAAPTDVQLDLIDPGVSEADGSLGTPDIQDTADAAMAMPDVYSRTQWGADETIRSWEPEYAATMKAATLHHTAGSNTYTSDQVPQILRSIYRYHAVSLGWGDIGYNVIVDKFGRLWEGRSGGLASTVIGAHAGGFNTGTFGVSMLGNYDTANTTQPMVDAVGAIIAWKFSLYGLDAFGRTVLTSAGGGTAKYRAGARVTLPTIFGHQDVGSTACPGRYGYARLGEIRSRVDDLLARSVTPEITAHYDADPALRTLLGPKTGPEQAVDGVVRQPYRGGSLFYAPATGVVLVRGAVLSRYLRSGGPAALGAPTLGERTLADGRGVVAEFQRAGIYWTATTGAHVVQGPIRTLWNSAGGPTGTLGYPVTSHAGTPDGVGALTVFERGTVMWSPPTGAVVLRGGIRAVFERSGRERGPLGYPTTAETAIPGGRGTVQDFQHGAIFWTPASYGALVHGDVHSTWLGTGGVDGPLGRPAGGELVASGSGRMQQFERGAVYLHPTLGSFPVRGAILRAWRALGAEAGAAGYPVGQEESVGDGRGAVQHFQNGSIYWSASTGAQVVRGGVRSAWSATGGPAGPLGYPTSGEDRAPGRDGRMQSFEQGTVYWSVGTGAQAVRGGIATAYEAAGASAGPLGLPTGRAVTTPGDGLAQHFEDGSIYWSQRTGGQIIRGGVRSKWLASGGPAGPLGHPTTGEVETPGRDGRMQSFEKGTVYWSAATGARIVRGAMATAHARASGVLGLPTGDAVATSDGAGLVQPFQRGSIYWSAATDAHVVRGAIGATWLRRGGTSGRLGYPTGSETATGTGAVQQFQRGSISWTTTTASTSVRIR